MDTRTAIACAGFLVVTFTYLAMKRQQRRSRQQLGFYKATFLPMKLNDPEQFFKYTRMDVRTFETLFNLLKPHFVPKMKVPDKVSLEERLAVTLHYLSQGSSIQTTALEYKLELITVHGIIREICLLIWNVLGPIYLKAPTTTAEWLNIASAFESKWNFPNCIGAMDAKHIQIQAKSFSIVLLACADVNYKFIFINIGAYGSQSVGSIFNYSIFGQLFENDCLNVPPPRQLPGTHVAFPYVLVASEAFPLKEYIMKPYSGQNLAVNQKIFNYRLSRAHRVVENTFGILAARWRILQTTIVANTSTVDKILQALVCLHNFILTENASQYCPPGFVDSDDAKNGVWRQDTKELQSLGRPTANNAARTTKAE